MGAVPDYDGMSVEEFDRTRLWHTQAKVRYVHDGDTFVALQDLGNRVRFDVHVRIADLYAPELTHGGGAAELMALRQALPAGWLMGPFDIRLVSRQLETVTEQDTSFERAVSDVYVVQDGILRNIRGILK